MSRAEGPVMCLPDARTRPCQHGEGVRQAQAHAGHTVSWDSLAQMCCLLQGHVAACGADSDAESRVGAEFASLQPGMPAGWDAESLDLNLSGPHMPLALGVGRPTHDPSLEQMGA